MLKNEVSRPKAKVRSDWRSSALPCLLRRSNCDLVKTYEGEFLAQIHVSLNFPSFRPSQLVSEEFSANCNSHGVASALEETDIAVGRSLKNFVDSAEDDEFALFWLFREFKRRSRCKRSVDVWSCDSLLFGFHGGGAALWRPDEFRGFSRRSAWFCV